MQTDYDVIILGGGPAGLSAGIYAARNGLKTLLIEDKMPGGQLINTARLVNYPGFTAEGGGAELAQRMEKQAREFGTEIRVAAIKKVDVRDRVKKIDTGQEKLTAGALIIATGSEPRKMMVPGEKEFIGRGVSYCATCDGAFYKNMDVVVVGGGDSALKEALHLTNFASKVTVIHRRDELRAIKALQDEAFSSEKIEFVLSSVIKEIYGNELVEGVVVTNRKTGEKEKLPAEGVFIYIGTKPNTQLVNGQVELTRNEHIITSERMATSTPGVFAAGDVRKKYLRQVITAAADGAIAATSAGEYLRENASP